VSGDRHIDEGHRAFLLRYMHQYCRGAERARTGASLARALTAQARMRGLSLSYSERKVRQIIQSVRRERDPRHIIGSLPDGSAGYFVCVSLDEAERVSLHMRSRVREQAETLRDFEAAAHEAFGLKQLRFRFDDAKEAV